VFDRYIRDDSVDLRGGTPGMSGKGLAWPDIEMIKDAVEVVTPGPLFLAPQVLVALRPEWRL
jgi:hypothetical protein